MININKKSSIYRLALYGSQFETYKIPTNLCPFIRHVLYGIGWCLLLVLVAVIIGGYLLAPIGMGIVSLYTGFDYIINDVVIVGLIFYGIGLFMFLLLVLYHIKDETTILEDAYTKVDSITSIHVVILWLKALHEKTCPQIGFK